jgi:hypothetical protein
MSVSPVSSASQSSATQTAVNSAKVQLDRDEKQLVADTKAKASQAQLAADAAAIVNDQLAIVEAASSTVGTYL